MLEMRAISLTKMSLRSARAVALLRALEAAANGLPRSRESNPDTFSRVWESRLMDLGWTEPNVRMTVERDLALVEQRVG